MLNRDVLESFVAESNRIEGINKTTEAEVEAHAAFLESPLICENIIRLVKVIQPDALFRNKPEVPGVRVGSHIAPPSGPNIERKLNFILGMGNPWEQHIAYETLHPFTDGNGRSGRALWLWRRWDNPKRDPYAIKRGFLHSFYYETLQNVRA